MTAMGLSEYCIALEDVDADLLVRKAHPLEACCDDVKPVIRERASSYRRALDWHYEQLCEGIADHALAEPVLVPLEAETVNH